MPFVYFNTGTGKIIKPRGLIEINKSGKIEMENKIFYGHLKHVLRDFHRTAFPVIKKLIGDQDIKGDHFAIAMDGWEAYQDLKTYAVAKGAKILTEVMHKERRISLWRYDKPWKIDDLNFLYVEAGEPKPDQKINNRLAHVAYLIDEENREQIFIDLFNKIKNNERIILKNGLVEYLREIVWRNKFVGFKMNVFVNGEVYEVEILKEPIGEFFLKKV